MKFANNDGGEMSSQPKIPNSMLPLEDAEETLRAIRYGTVDAFVVQEAEGHRVYTLEGSDLPYSTLVERMQQGAAMLDTHGCIVYCNLSLAQLLGMPRESVIGRLLQDFVPSTDQPSYRKLKEQALVGSSEGEISLRVSDGGLVPANFTFNVLSLDKSAIGVLITDLTFRKQQIELASRLQSVQDEERRRIARELHDSVGQLLAALSMNIATLDSQANRLDESGTRALSENAALVGQITKEIRTISYLLHPPLLEVAGLASAVRWYVDGFSERSKIQVEVQIATDLRRLSEQMEIAIFRLVQECLTNIHRHSGSKTALVAISQQELELIVEIKDAGKGIPLSKQSELSSGRAGVGFRGMRERLRQFGGDMKIQSGSDGTSVIATIPLAKCSTSEAAPSST